MCDSARPGQRRDKQFEFGLFEGLISHFHRNLHELIAGVPDSGSDTTPRSVHAGWLTRNSLAPVSA